MAPPTTKPSNGLIGGFFASRSNRTLSTLVLVWVAVIHAANLYLFSQGFLLKRLALSEKNACVDAISCTLPPTHSKAILLIIDSLRFDFISPHPPQPIDAYHHNILTLPAELTSQSPDRSFIFNAYSDPPTATLQRIKGITTGSLPTFVDIGSNFGGSEILEDSLIHQLNAAGKRIAFMGDDTWKSVYPNSFHPNMTWPYDSFNVEDLHTVDEGVIRHLFPLLEGDQSEWDFIIGHFLGVDHAGHRVGPSGEAMRSKLKQMDDVLRKVVEKLDDDTLLVVLGDHGMDLRGDHGGDGLLETSSALWVYSKLIPLAEHYPSDGYLKPPAHEDQEPLPWTTFPGADQPTRSVKQIDIVPSLSLLLGIPIPFSNLGMVIPELFLRGPSKSSLILEDAMKLNAQQVRRYLEAYRSSPSGGELGWAWDDLNTMYRKAGDDAASIDDLRKFLRRTLDVCRSQWAQFNEVVMTTGTALLALSVFAAWRIYRALDQPVDSWREVAVAVLTKGSQGGLAGLVVFVPLSFALPGLKVGWDILPIIGGTLGSLVAASTASLGTKTPSPSASFSKASLPRTIIPSIILILHVVSYTSNSFILWEDKITSFFLFTLLFLHMASSTTAITRALRLRIFGFSITAAILVRAIASSTVCREEQHPYCHVTFYSSSTTPIAPLITSIGAPLSALILPWIVKRFLERAKSNKGVAPLFIDYLWKWCLGGATVYWLLERLEGWDGLNPDRIPLVQTFRTYLARLVLGSCIALCGGIWWDSPPCVEIQREVKTVDDGSQKMFVTVLGFANAYGSSYLLFFLTAFALVFATAQPTGQVVLALALVVILCYVEIIDSQNESTGTVEAFTSGDITSAAAMKSRPQRPAFIVPAFLSILAISMFYATGHQAVLSTIQWRTAFIGFPTVSYLFSPILVILNTFGPIALPAVAVPLFALWNVDPPIPTEQGAHQTQENKVLANSLKLSIGVSLYHSALTFGAAGAAGLLRRHLMVWKVFAPRFMLGAASLLVVDLALILGMGVGVGKVVGKVEKMFVPKGKKVEEDVGSK